MLGVNIAAWGIIGLLHDGLYNLTTVRLCVAALNLFVGVLIVFRRQEMQQLQLDVRSWWLPAILCTGALFRISEPFADWAIAPTVLFVVGTAIALVSFGFLGRSFSIRPAAVQLMQRGPYRLVRHPAYLGEQLMALACALAIGTWYAAVLFVGLSAFQVLRILQEERVLATANNYHTYSFRTKYRLIPGIW